MNSILSSLLQLPTRGALQALGDGILSSAHSFGRRINSVVNVERAVIITALALSSLALIASLFTGSFLALSLSAGLIVLLAYSAKTHDSLMVQRAQNVSLQSHLTNEARLAAERGTQIEDLKKTKGELAQTNEEFKRRIAEVMPLVTLTREALSQTKGSIDGLLSAVTAARDAEHEEEAELICALRDQKATIELHMSVADKLKGDLSAQAARADRVARDILTMMTEFSTEQKVALSGFLAESQALKDEIARHREQIQAQLAELRGIQAQIAASARTLGTLLARHHVSPVSKEEGEDAIEVTVKA